MLLVFASPQSDIPHSRFSAKFPAQNIFCESRQNYVRTFAGINQYGYMDHESSHSFCGKYKCIVIVTQIHFLHLHNILTASEHRNELYAGNIRSFGSIDGGKFGCVCKILKKMSEFHKLFSMELTIQICVASVPLWLSVCIWCIWFPRKCASVLLARFDNEILYRMWYTVWYNVMIW